MVNTLVININLKESGEVLDEIVITGYSTSTKRAYAGTATTIKAEVLDEKNFSNISQALTGEVAGVNVINTSGQPGTVAPIRIRGYGSVNGNRAPLYGVDGAPYTGSINAINPSDIASTTILKDATATAIYGSRGANGVVIITTKSGSATKSFIEVDFRTSINDQLIPRYDVIDNPEEYIGYVWEGLYNRARFTGSVDPVADANNTLFNGNGIGEGYNMWNVDSATDLIDPSTGTVRSGVSRKYTPVRYEDAAIDAAFRTEVNLKMGGGSPNSRYYASVGYLDDNGFSINTSYKRYTARINLNSEVKPWLKLTANAGYAYSESINNGQTVGSENVFEFADKMAPIYPVFQRDTDGNKIEDTLLGGFLYDFGLNRPNANSLNPIASAVLDFDGTQRHEVNANFNLDFKITDNLTFQTRYSTQYAQSENQDFTNPFYGSFATDNGRIFLNNNTFLTETFLKMLKYENSFGDHALDISVAHENYNYTRTFRQASKRNMASPFILELDNFIEVINQPRGFEEGFSIESIFGQINYSFKQKYYLTASLRTDGSSRFVNEKWGAFGSVGGAWVATAEDFLSDNALISFLKLKVSYGITGDQAGVGFYSGYDTFNVANLDGSLSISPLDNGNPNLTWETSKQFQFGTEFSLGSFIDGTLDYYDSRTDNLIFNRRVGPSQGIAIITVNDGELRNSGLEFDLTGHLIKKDGFSLDLTVNGEIPRNEILQMPIDPATGLPKFLDDNGTNGAWTQGRSIFDFYIPEWAGVDPADGSPMWYQYYDDLNNNGVLDADEPSSFSSNPWFVQDPNDPANSNSINTTSSLPEYESLVSNANIKKTTTKTYADATDLFVDKSSIPKIRGAFRLTASIGDFSIASQFTYSLGGYAYDGQYGELMSDRFGAAGNNYHKNIANRWTQPGDITNVPRLADALDITASSFSTRFLTSTDFIALNNLNIGYNFPNKYLKNSGLSNVNIFISGDNLFIKTARNGWLPNTSESGNSGRRLYAPVTTLTLGVRFKF